VLKYIHEERKGAFGVRGKVRWFNNEKGYGFVECEGFDDIFVHYSAIKKDGYKTLKEGILVEFKLIETTKGLQAVDVYEVQLTTTK
jgi:cold shock protein